MVSIRGWNVNEDGFASIIVVPKDNPESTTVKVGIPDKKWGPWVSVNHAGQATASVIITPPYQEAYAAIRPYGVQPRVDRCLFTWTYDDDQGHLAVIELVAVDVQGVRHRPHGSTNWDDANGVTRNADLFDHSVETIDHFEYRLRPYRHWITFENVSLEPGQKTNFKTSIETVAIPPAEEKVSVSGRIVGPDGAPATTKGWMYYHSESASGARLFSSAYDKDEFELQSVAGESFIALYPTRFAPIWTTKMNLNAGDIVEGIVLKLERGFETTAQIRTADGAPIAGAVLIASPLIHGSTQGPNFPLHADESGEVSLKHLADTKYSFRVEEARFEPLRTEPMTVPPNTPLVLTMQAAKPTTGVVLHSDGTPADGAKLRILKEITQGQGNVRYTGQSGGFPGRVVAVTDDQGRFLLDQLSTGSRYLSIIEGPDRSRLLYRDFQIGQSELTIQLPKRRDLRIELRGDLAPYFREGDTRYVNVRQSVSLNSPTGNLTDLVGDRAPIEPNSTGGTAIYRGLVVDPQADEDDQSVSVNFGSLKRTAKRFLLNDQETNSVDWTVGELPEGVGNDTSQPSRIRQLPKPSR